VLIARREFGEPLAEALLRNTKALDQLGLRTLAINRLAHGLRWVAGREPRKLLIDEQTTLLSAAAHSPACPTLREVEPLLFARLEYIRERFYCSLLPEMAQLATTTLQVRSTNPLPSALSLHCSHCCAFSRVHFCFFQPAVNYTKACSLQGQLGQLIVAARALLERTFALGMSCQVHGECRDPPRQIPFPGNLKGLRKFMKECPEQCAQLRSLLKKASTREMYAQLVNVSNRCKHGQIEQPPLRDWSLTVRVPSNPIDELLFFSTVPDQPSAAAGRWISGSALLERSLHMIEDLMRIVDEEVYTPRLRGGSFLAPANPAEIPSTALLPLDRLRVSMSFSVPPTATEVLECASECVGVPIRELALVSMIRGSLRGEERVSNEDQLFLFNTQPNAACNLVPIYPISLVTVHIKEWWWWRTWNWVRSAFG